MLDYFQTHDLKYSAAKKLLDEAVEKKMMPDAKQARVLADFTGDAYRLILEEGFDSLTE